MSEERANFLIFFRNTSRVWGSLNPGDMAFERADAVTEKACFLGPTRWHYLIGRPQSMGDGKNLSFYTL